MKIELTDPHFQAALPILKQIESHGYEAYFVGGCVRDTLLNQTIHDIDIASSATPDEIQAIFHSTVEVGKEHGTIVVIENKATYEITTFRTEEGYTDYRRPDQVSFVRNLEEDTLRRDFTINALAIDRSGILYDYHEGVKDLNQELIRAVGEPQERFNEDALRMMRAIRFASQLGFTIESKTFTAIQNLAPLITKIAIERIRIEFSKYLMGNHFNQTFDLLTQTGIDQYIELGSSEKVVGAMKQLANELEPYISEQIDRDERLCWIRLMHQLDITDVSMMRQFLKHWTHSNQFINDIIKLHELFSLSLEELQSDWIVYQYSDELLHMVEVYYILHTDLNQPFVKAKKEALPILSRDDIPVNGADIIQLLNMEKGGPIVGELLAAIEYNIVNGQLENDRNKIEAFVLQVAEKNM